MSFLGIEKQIKVYPLGGLCNQRTNDLVPANDATVCINADPSKALAGGVMKSGDTNQILDAVASFARDHQNYLFNQGTFVNGPDLLQLGPSRDSLGFILLYVAWAHRNREEWEFIGLGPFYKKWGIPFRVVPRDFLKNNTPYRAIPEGSNITFEHQFSYWFNGNVDLDTIPNAYVLAFHAKIVGNSYQPAYDLVSLQFDNLNSGAIKFSEVNVVNSRMGGAFYAYHFIQEDVMGNVGPALTDRISLIGDDNREFFRHLSMEYTPTDFETTANRISINIPDKLMPGLKHIHIFRSTSSPASLEFAAQDLPYYHIATLDVYWTQKIHFDDTTHDAQLVEEAPMEDFFNDNVPPKDLLLDDIQKINTGVIHQGRLYGFHDNGWFSSGENHHRNFFDQDNGVLPEAGRIVQGVSGVNRLIMLTENSVWIWNGRSQTEMDAIRPKKVWDFGLPFYETQAEGYHRTAMRWGDLTLFVDSDGYPRMLRGETVLHLSDDGFPKVRITGTHLEATISDSEYRVTNQEQVFVCAVDKNFAWHIDPIQVKTFMQPNIEMEQQLEGGPVEIPHQRTIGG